MTMPRSKKRQEEKRQEPKEPTG